MADTASNTPVQSDTETPTIRVYVANLGKYNEGELVGAWLDLPQSREKIDEFLRDTVGLTLDSEEAYAKGLRGERVYEEYAIHDFEFPQDMNGFTPNLGEYTSLDKVNVLACLIEQADEDCLEVIEALQNQIEKLNIDEQISMLGHFVSGEYPELVWRFDREGYKSEEEAFGYHNVFELNPELSKILEEQNIESYFDFEHYGRECAMDGYLYDDIYIDGQSDIFDWKSDLSCEDVEENILVDHYDKDYFQSFGDKKLWDEREALGKKHGFELERDDDDYYYCRTFRPEEGKDINTIVEYDTEAQQWKAYTVDFNQPGAPRIGEAIYRSDAAGAFAMGNSLYAEICEMADVLSDAPERLRAAETLDKSSLYGFERNGEGSFVKQFEVYDAVNPQIMTPYETEVSWDDEQKQWEVCTTNLDTGKTEDVLWEAEIKDALKEADDQVREISDGSFFRNRTLQQRSEERVSERERTNEAHEEIKTPKTQGPDTLDQAAIAGAVVGAVSVGAVGAAASVAEAITPKQDLARGREVAEALKTPLELNRSQNKQL